MDSTIIYYTANTEDPKFEKIIRNNIVKNSGGLPIISVSRKPIKMGKNICVGEQPICYSNSFRQLLIGLKEAKTKYCIAAESDVLYPPKYFQFTPPLEDQVYRYTNLYVYFDGHENLWRKDYVEAAQMCGREYWIKSIEKVLHGTTSWDPIPFEFIFKTKDKYQWWTDQPVVTFKTRKGIGFKTGFFPGSFPKIPYWGSIKKIRKMVHI